VVDIKKGLPLEILKEDILRTFNECCPSLGPKSKVFFLSHFHSKEIQFFKGNI